MAKMRAVQVPYAGGPFEIVERDIPEAEAGMVRIKVQACGVCHSDSGDQRWIVSRDSVPAHSGPRGDRTD